MSFRKKPKTIDPVDVDPSVYYYDEVYDDMKSEEKAEKEAAARNTHLEKQGSKYIKGLLETAEQRKTEKEIQKFKKFARDREKAEQEGSINETEVYITSSYKKKLDEIRKLDAENRLTTGHEEGRSSSLHEDKSIKKIYDQEYDQARFGQPERNTQSRPSSSGAKERPEPERSSTSGRYTKEMRNSEDKRRYLEEVLAKRTVGIKFNEALDRYRIRKNQI